MREDHQETLDKMFPDGYLLLYALGTDLRMSIYNPHNYAAFPEYMDHFIAVKHSGEGRDMPTLLSQIVHQIHSSEPERIRLHNIKRILEGEPLDDAGGQ